MRKYRITIGYSILILLIFYPHAFSNTFDIFGANPRSIALGGAYTALANDPAAVYYNPAALTRIEYTQLEAGYIFAGASLSAGRPSPSKLENLTCYNPATGENISCKEMDELHYGSGGTLDQVSLNAGDKSGGAISPWDTDDIDGDGILEETLARATVDYQNNNAQNIQNVNGYSIGIAAKINDYFSFGLLYYAPTDTYISQQLKLVWEPFYLDYDTRPKRAIILPGVGFKILPFLSVGASMNLLLSTSAKTRAFFPLDDPNQTVAVTNQSEVNNNPSFNFSLLLTPMKDLSFGINYIEEAYLKVTTQSEISATILGITKIGIPTLIKASGHYSPRSLTVGAAYTLSQELTVSADIEWSDWSEYIPPFPRAILLTPTGQTGVIGDILDDPINQPIPLLHFSDTITPRIGVEYSPIQYLTLRMGFYYEPSPIPKQTFSTNILDNNTYTISGGIGTQFKVLKNVPFLPEKAKIDIFGQISRLIPQTVVKDQSFFQTNYNDNLRSLKDTADPDGDGNIDNPNAYNVYTLYLQSLLTRGMIRDEVNSCEGVGDECHDQTLNTVNPGYPAYTYGGTVYSIGVTLSAYF